MEQKQHSFKSLMKEGVFKRVDGFRVLFKDLVIEPGFNLRMEGPDLDAHREAMFQHLMAGGDFPPLEVRVSDDGKVVVVDGHNRHAVYARAIEAGAPIEWVDVIPFRGNDVDRVARIITSQEGRKLTPLELAMGYKRLAAFKLTADDIAKRFSKTRQHVDQLLLLANANHDVHELVAAGLVSAAVAVEQLRKHGEATGQVLKEQLDKANGSGKKKVTRGVIEGKPLPKKQVAAVVDSLDGFLEALPKETRLKIAERETAADFADAPVDGMVEVPAAALMHLLHVHQQLEEARKASESRQREKAAKASQGELEDGEGAAAA